MSGGGGFGESGELPEVPEGDEIGELLRLANADDAAVPGASVERASRHRQAARAHWQRAVRLRRRRRRYAGLAAAAAVATVLGVGLEKRRMPAPPGGPAASVEPLARPTSEPSGPVARVAAVAGPVHDRRLEPSTRTALAEDSAVAAGAILETESESRAAVELACGHELRLDVDTRLRLVADSVLALERGAVYVDSRRSGTSLEIRTPLGIARDVGTRFEVRLDADSLRVRVREGVVEVERAGETHEARTGVEITLDPSGGLERRAVALYGSQWRWSLEVAPTFDIEGRTLSEFLGWVTRETAWQLRIDPIVAEGAAAVVLSGSIAGLLPDEALSVVLPTSGLRHRVVDGVLVVETLEAPRDGERQAG